MATAPYRLERGAAQREPELRVPLFVENLRRIGGYSASLARRAARAVMCALDQELPPEGAEQAPRPARLCTLLHRCKRHREAPAHRLDVAGFFRVVADDLANRADVESAVRAVFAALREELSEESANAIASQLPPELAELWRMPA